MEDSENLFRNVIRSQMKSTYRTDYSGIQLGTPREVINTNKYTPISKSHHLNFKNDTEARFHYQYNKQNEILTNNTTRYGCNVNHKKYAIGGSPNYSPFLRGVSNSNSLSDVFC